MPTERNVASLVSELGDAELAQGDPWAHIGGVEHDSRRVGPGGLFVAIPGFSVDGHTFLAQVIGAGATAVIVQKDHAEAWRGLPPGATVIAVDDTRKALASASAWFYDHPGREMVVVGITGTDGKTTTSHMLTSVLEAAGAKVGRLGTVDVHIPGEETGSLGRMTTPEANEVQRLMRRMADAGCEYAIVESTSHGLALNRLDHVEYDIAAFTNVTGDHLDFHKTFEAYRDAKGQLFAALDSAFGKGVPKVAVVNDDDPSASYMASRSKAETIRYGLESRDADVLGRNVVLRAEGSDFRLMTRHGMAEVSIQIPALFNVANALAAAGVGLAAGLDAQTIAHGLGACPGVPGRMERIDAGQPFTVIVDYAHTGEAVRKVLEVLRAVCIGRLIVVVGAAGERDPGRRYSVGRAAATGADFAIFTNEDPRSEDPGEIVREIGHHAEGAGRVRGTDFVEIEERREAIAHAVRMAKPDDVLVILGKGHEQSMIYGTTAIPWDDRTVTREELGRLGFVRG